MRTEVWSLSRSGGTRVPDLGVFSRLFPAMTKCLLSPDLARSLGLRRVNTQNAAARRKQNTWQNIFGCFAISHRVFAKGPAAQRSCRQQVLSITPFPSVDLGIKMPLSCISWGTNHHKKHFGWRFSSSGQKYGLKSAQVATRAALGSRPRSLIMY